MKRLFMIAGLMAAFLLVVVTASAQNANFAGTWSLDKAKSQGLSQRMQGADKVTLTITQDAKTISLDQKVEAASPGGRRRRWYGRRWRRWCVVPLARRPKSRRQGSLQRSDLWAKHRHAHDQGHHVWRHPRADEQNSLWRTCQHYDAEAFTFR